MPRPALISAGKDWTSFRERIERVAGLVGTYDLLKELAHDAGYRHFAILKSHGAAGANLSPQFVLTSLPHGSVQEYQDMETASGDMALLNALQAGHPFFWDCRTPMSVDTSTVGAENDNRGTDRLLARLGIRTGLGLPVFSTHAPHGFALFGGERSVPDIGEAAQLSLWCNGLYERMTAFEPPDRGQSRPRLTARELQCLSWTSAGKTSVEIAAILGLSEHTVNQYVATTSQKLGAVNRTQAVAKAIRLRLIE